MSISERDQILTMFAQSPEPFPLNDGALAIRAWVEAASSRMPPADHVRIEQIHCGPCDGEFLLPEGGDASRLIIFYHGGGFFFGSSATHRVLASYLARAANCAVLVPDYRLAPEHIAPAAHDDAFGVYQWALTNGYDADKIALGGDSAGGNLAVMAALRARDAGLPLPAALAVMSPWVDFVAEGASYQEVKDDPMVSLQLLDIGLKAYIGPDDLRSSLTTPLCADLTGLPPVLVHVGGWEILRDDAVVLVRRLQAAGVTAELKIFDGMFHTWQRYASMLDEGMASIAETAAFITARQGVRS